jgi:hypothetical protein
MREGRGEDMAWLKRIEDALLARAGQNAGRAQ